MTKLTKVAESKDRGMETADGINVEKMKQVCQKILVNIQAKIAKSKKIQTKVGLFAKRNKKKALALGLAGTMTLTMAACTPIKMSEQTTSLPNQCQSSQITPSRPQTTEDIQTQEVPIETPTNNTTEEIHEDDTSTMENNTQNTNDPAPDLSVWEYGDSIVAELNLGERAGNLQKEGYFDLLNKVEELCAKYNCVPAEVETHKKIAIGLYFRGLADIEVGDRRLDNPDLWQEQEKVAYDESHELHGNLER